MFGRANFREDGKKKKENEERNFFGKCLVERGRERIENDGGA